MSYERSVVKNNLLKKRLEDSLINLAKFQETQSQREKEVAENNMAAQAKIKDLKSKFEALQTISECIQKDHSAIHAKFTFSREEADQLNTKLLDITNEMAVYHNKAETLSQSVLNMKMKFRKARKNCANIKKRLRASTGN
jgi:chromosome segregation ATPase